MDSPQVTLPSETIPFIQFALRVINDSWMGGDVDGGDIQDWGEKYGLFEQVPYNPAIHGAGGGEMGIGIGDPIFVLTETAKQIEKRVEHV
jgi:hypothetical protein